MESSNEPIKMTVTLEELYTHKAKYEKFCEKETFKVRGEILYEEDGWAVRKKLIELNNLLHKYLEDNYLRGKSNYPNLKEGGIIEFDNSLWMGMMSTYLQYTNSIDLAKLCLNKTLNYEK
jgi:hypothetical protein